MAKYLKPQTPLQHQSGDYIYPITTVDQIIMEDGSRLNTFVKEETITEAKTYTNQQITDRIIYGKGKNLLKNTAKSQTVNGITFTVNDDGSVTVNGTATNAMAFPIGDVALSAGSYKLSGCPSGGSTGTYYLYSTLTDGTKNLDKGNGVPVNTTTDTNSLIQIGIVSGVTFNNLTFYPMIRLASETDNTYEPYYEGLKELTDRGMELVWENPSPTSAFESRSISLDFQDADMAFVEPSTGSGVIVRKGKVCEAGALNVWATGANSGNFHFRKIHLEDNGVHFYGGVVLNFTNGTAAENNDTWIPLRIYKIKGASA